MSRLAEAPFTDHPYVAAIPAERVSWHAERTRLTGASDPAAWGEAAEAWQALGYRHCAGYALSRQAQALLSTGQAAAASAVLRSAAAAAEGHAPLQAEIGELAKRMHVPPQARPGTVGRAVGRRPDLHGSADR